MDSITATETVDGQLYRLTLEKDDGGQYREVAREPISSGVVRRVLGWPYRAVGWPFRLARRLYGDSACWLERAWADTDPSLDEVPGPEDPRLPTDEQLRADGLSDAAIARLRKNPGSFPHTLRRHGFDFGRPCGRGKGLATRIVGSVHFAVKRR